MTEEKRNRIAAAITVNVILLIFILAAVVVYQLAVITRANKQRQALREEIEFYNQQYRESEDLYERLQMEEFLMEKLVEYGYKFPD